MELVRDSLFRSILTDGNFFLGENFRDTSYYAIACHDAVTWNGCNLFTQLALKQIPATLCFDLRAANDFVIQRNHRNSYLLC